MSGPLKKNQQFELQDSSMIVGWTGDTGRLGDAITSYLIRKLNGQMLHEIDPEDYFQLGGVTIEDDLVQFPESKFYTCPDYNLVIFQSASPTYEPYDFINKVLDFARRECHVKEIYTVGGMVSLTSHIVPRTLVGTYNTAKVKEDLAYYDMDSNSNYETPPGQKPTLNSYLLWISKKWNLAGAGLWVPVPFYLMSLDDPKSQKKILEFFNQRLGLEMDLSEFDREIIKQNRKINEVRNIYPEIDDYFTRIESNLTLSEDENMKLVSQVEEYLKGN